MEKKLVRFASAAILLSVISTGFAETPIQATRSPFTDMLKIHFVGFPQETVFYASYVTDNGVNISGPGVAKTDYDADVKIFSNNRLENGRPSMTIQYPALFSDQSCTLTFWDGPYVPWLTYAAGSAPICPGVTASAILKTGQDAYALTITDSEP